MNSPRQKKKKLYKRLIKRGYLTGLEIAMYKIKRPSSWVGRYNQDVWERPIKWKSTRLTTAPDIIECMNFWAKSHEGEIK